jgi:hypothetical protein
MTSVRGHRAEKVKPESVVPRHPVADTSAREKVPGFIAVVSGSRLSSRDSPEEEPDVSVDRQALASTLQVLLQTMDLPPETDDRALTEHLDRVMEAARDVLGVDGVGLLLLDEDDRLCLVGASDAASTALERGQQLLNIGPAIDCVRGATTVMVTDLAAHSRYLALWHWLTDQARSFSRSGGDSPARAVLSAPVRVRGSVTGTLNALRRRPERWSADQVQAIEAYGNIIGVLLRLGDRPGLGGT